MRLPAALFRSIIGVTLYDTSPAPLINFSSAGGSGICAVCAIATADPKNRLRSMLMLPSTMLAGISHCSQRFDDTATCEFDVTGAAAYCRRFQEAMEDSAGGGDSPKNSGIRAAPFVHDGLISTLHGRTPDLQRGGDHPVGNRPRIAHDHDEVYAFNGSRRAFISRKWACRDSSMSFRAASSAQRSRTSGGMTTRAKGAGMPAPIRQPASTSG